MPLKPSGLCAKSTKTLNSLNLKIFILPGVCAADGINVSKDVLISSVLKPHKNVVNVAAKTF